MTDDDIDKINTKVVSRNLVCEATKKYMLAIEIKCTYVFRLLQVQLSLFPVAFIASQNKGYFSGSSNSNDAHDKLKLKLEMLRGSMILHPVSNILINVLTLFCSGCSIRWC